MSTPQSFRDIIDLWPSKAALARQIGVNGSRVRAWHGRDSIPEKHFAKIVRCAKKAEFEGITYAAMIRLQRGGALQVDEAI